MWIERKALAQEIPAAAGLNTRELSELLASLGFPVDGVAAREGSDVLDVDITANRGDAMSHRGLAREIAAKLNQPLSSLALLSGKSAVKEGAPQVEVRLEAPACPIYATAILDLGKGASPAEVQAFLRALESTPKGLPAVDASNELLHRYGHPTHAFDAERIRGPVSVRWAKAGESLVTLDGLTRTLTEKDLVIADASAPIALAGVMGGEATKVTEATRRVLLESAWFDPKTVRATARRHSLHTDASHRFGRGADPAMATQTRDLLVARLQAWCGAKLAGAWTVGAVPSSTMEVPLPTSLLTRLAGEPLSLVEAAEILSRLGCTVKTQSEGLQVRPPSWRHDLSLPEDLAEEVLRLRGYEQIPSVLPPLEGPPQPLSQDYLKRQRLARRLAHLGFHQAVTYGFVSPEMEQQARGGPEGILAPLDIQSRTLSNPLGQEYSILRKSLVPSLVEAAKHNIRQGQREVRLFEIAPTFHGASSGPLEWWTVALVWAGKTWDEDPESNPLLVEAKHMLGILKHLRKPDTDQRIMVEVYNQITILKAEGNLNSFLEVETGIVPVYTPQSRFPSVERDLSLVVSEDLTWQKMEEAIKKALPGPDLTDLTCADLYRGKSLPTGTKAWLARLTFQSMDRTLLGEEVDGWMASALAAAEALGAKLRA